ncbi:hypothetical protein D1007_11346 [Hordeum vulgare]|nr:hypothetical protein D1007_11346 [Hordeum vulgare]
MVSWSEDNNEDSFQYDSASDADIIKEGKNCGLVEWIEQAWPATLENASAMLWEMYEECKINKIEDKVMSSFAVHNLTQEKIKL